MKEEGNPLEPTPLNNEGEKTTVAEDAAEKRNSVGLTSALGHDEKEPKDDTAEDLESKEDSGAPFNNENNVANNNGLKENPRNGNRPIFVPEEEEGDAVDIDALREQQEQTLLEQGNQPTNGNTTLYHTFCFHYYKLSLLAALVLIHHAMRTRVQIYLAVRYLNSSKLSYAILGNAFIVIVIKAFHLIVWLFLGELRQTDMESINDSIRWDAFEIGIDLIVFGSEVGLRAAALFVLLVVAKCLNHAVELQGNHMRMAKESFYVPTTITTNRHGPNTTTNPLKLVRRGIFYLPRRLVFMILPKFLLENVLYLPRPHWSQIRWFLLTQCLISFHRWAIDHCLQSLKDSGYAFYFFFEVQAAMLFVDAIRIRSTFFVHCVDEFISLWLEQTTYDNKDTNNGASNQHEDQEPEATMVNTNPNVPLHQGRSIISSFVVDLVVPVWKEHKTKLFFIVETTANGVQLELSVRYFSTMCMYYRVPWNNFYELLRKLHKFLDRMETFQNYVHLTSDMDNRFESVRTTQELEEAGGTCVICRDIMDEKSNAKRLPGCRHVFHRHCLREWLVQQRTCPTCRADIAKNDEKARDEKRKEEEEEEKSRPSVAEGEKSDIDDHGGDSGNVTMASASPLDLGSGTRESNSEESSSAPSTNPTCPETMTKSSSNIFSALYRVSSPKGASVLIYNAQQQSIIVRTVPKGKIILCTEGKWCSYHQSSQKEFEGCGMMLRMPDGWVCGDDLEQVGEIP